MKIAVYTIALNEEQFVETWYNSAKDADYLLIADTGSVDGTVEKAKALGINVVPISVKPWRFDVARNTALSLLPDDIDMCISLDMDERLSEGWREHLEKIRADKVTYQYVWNWKNDEETIPDNIFMNDKIHSRHNFVWKGLVHEYIVQDRTIPVIKNCPEITIYHHPDQRKPRTYYDDLVVAAEKEESAQGYRYAMYKARTLLDLGKSDEAIVIFKDMLQNKKLLPQDKSFIYMKMALYDEKNAVKLLKKSIEAESIRREPYVFLAAFYYKNKKYSKAYKYAKLATQITKKIIDMNSDNIAWGYLPFNILAASRNNKKFIRFIPGSKFKKFELNITSQIARNFDLFGEISN